MTQGESLPAIVPGALDPDLISDPAYSDPGRNRSYDPLTDPTASWSDTSSWDTTQRNTDPSAPGYPAGTAYGNGYATGAGYTGGNGYATGGYTNGYTANGYTGGNPHHTGSYPNGQGYPAATSTNGHGYPTATYPNGNGYGYGYGYTNGPTTNGHGYPTNGGNSGVTSPGASGQWTQAPGAGPQTGGWQTVPPNYQAAAPAQVRAAEAAATPVPAAPATPAAASTITAEATTSPGMRAARHRSKAKADVDPDIEIGELSPPGRHERTADTGRTSFVQKTVEAAHTAAVEDARLLTALRALLTSQSLYPRLLFLAAGFAAIGPLALSYIEFLPLPQGARYVLLPASLLVILLTFLNRQWGRRAMTGYFAGVVATLVYDCVRWSLIPTGIWEDPIPDIGRQLLNDPDALWVWGYVWRFFGNGAGMGMAFAMLPWRGVKSGIIYGCVIATGLFVVLFVFPVSQSHFFPLTPFTFVGGYIGHIVYGGILGWIVSYLMPPPTDPAVRTQEFAAAGARS